MKILVAADGSAFTKRMLGYVAAHDEWLGSQHDYTVITSTMAVPPHASAALDRDLVKGYYADEAEQVFKPIRSFLAKQGIAAKFVSKVGPAADAICKLAEAGHFDLIIMGSHGHSSLAGLVLGSVASKVLAGCKTPVLIVR
jgi:nucleotide-binding universal stress UspA family protein